MDHEPNAEIKVMHNLYEGSSFVFGKLLLFGTDKVYAQISEHIQL